MKHFAKSRSYARTRTKLFNWYQALLYSISRKPRIPEIRLPKASRILESSLQFNMSKSPESQIIFSHGTIYVIHYSGGRPYLCRGDSRRWRAKVGEKPRNNGKDNLETAQWCDQKDICKEDEWQRGYARDRRKCQITHIYIRHRHSREKCRTFLAERRIRGKWFQPSTMRPFSFIWTRNMTRL